MRRFSIYIICISLSLISFSSDDVFYSEKGRFSAAFPKHPKKSRMPDQNGRITHMFKVILRGGQWYSVDYTDYPEIRTENYKLKDFVELEQSLVEYWMLGTTLTSPVYVNNGHCDGGYFTARDDEEYWHYFMVIDDIRLYRVMVGGPKEYGDSTSVRNFIESFQIYPGRKK